MLSINKWLFYNVDDDISNRNFLKTLPFCVFTDQDINYDLIEKVLEKAVFNKDLLVGIGSKTPKFGVHVNPLGESLDTLLNSCRFSLILSSKPSDAYFMVKSVLASVMPICDVRHPFLRQLKLQDFAVEVNVDSIVDKLNDINKNPIDFRIKIDKLSLKYKKQWNKLHKK